MMGCVGVGGALRLPDYVSANSERLFNFFTQRTKTDTEVIPLQMIPIWGMDSSIDPNTYILPIAEPTTYTAAKNTTKAITNINHVAVFPHLDIFSTSSTSILVHNGRIGCGAYWALFCVILF